MGSRAAVRACEATGALGCALAVALGAYAAHGLDAAARTRVEPALLYLFLHGLTLTLLAARQSTRLERAALGCWLAGTVLFCGSVVGAVLAGFSTRLAPLGGLLLIAGWLLQAVAALRR
jgi:uncharacterized membrane protein YgdD (TMEM256/DUF423 family)